MQLKIKELKRLSKEKCFQFASESVNGMNSTKWWWQTDYAFFYCCWQCIGLHILPVLPSYIVMHFQFAVQQRITPELAVIPFKTLFLLALWLICQTLSITKHFHVLQYHFINCFCPYPAWRKHCQWKTLALALRQSGTYCHLTVARLSSPAHSNAC